MGNVSCDEIKLISLKLEKLLIASYSARCAAAAPGYPTCAGPFEGC